MINDYEKALNTIISFIPHVGVKALSNEIELITNALERFEVLEKESQELKQDVEDVLKDYNDATLKMFKHAEVIDKFIDYLDKEPNRSISKHSIKQTLNKLLKEVLGNE